MRKTKAESFDPTILKGRILVSDRELPYLLGMGAAAARAYADQCGAVVWIGENRKAYSVEKLTEGAR